MKQDYPRVPFNIGAPVRPPDFFGRNRELARLSESAEVGRNTMIVGPRKIGKTSLLLALQHRLQKKEPTSQVLFVDLQAGSEALVHELYSHFPFFKDPLGKVDLSPRKALLSISSVMKHTNSRLILLLDELDALRDEAILATLRALATRHHRNLTLVAAGFRIPDLQGPSSPLYNIFMIMHLGGFSREETHSFLSTRLSSLDLAPDKDFLNRAFALTGGYPFLLQTLGRAVVEAHNDRAKRFLDVTDLDSAVHELRYYLDRELYDLGLTEKLILRELAASANAQAVSELIRSIGDSVNEILPNADTLLPISERDTVGALSSLASRYLVVKEEANKFRLPHLLFRDLLLAKYELSSLLPSEPPVVATSFEKTRLPASTANDVSIELSLDSPSPVEITNIELDPLVALQKSCLSA